MKKVNIISAIENNWSYTSGASYKTIFYKISPLGVFYNW